MPTCRRCGAALGDGRYCTNCGQARDLPVEEPILAPTPYQAEPLAPPTDHRRRRGVPLAAWIVLVGALVAVLALIAVLLVDRGDDEPSAAPTTDAPTPGQSSPGSPASSAPTFDGDPGDLADLATAEAPDHDGDSVDIATGGTTTYVPGNMLDGDPTTAWRVSGDATGTVLTFTFGSPVTLTSVGLVNGYAKTSVDGAGNEFDLYSGTRRVKSVEWVLDGGTPVPQDLRRSRDPQVIDVGATQATTVELRIVAVSGPGKGRASRDDTAISEVSLTGYPD